MTHYMKLCQKWQGIKAVNVSLIKILSEPFKLLEREGQK